MFKKIILISMCLILLTSCGRKNEIKKQSLLDNRIMKDRISNLKI